MVKKFKERDPDKPATYKQKWALSFKFARLLKDEFPDFEESDLANKINGAIYYYHLERGEELTHEMVNNYFNTNTCPDIYINHLKKFLSKNPNSGSTSLRDLMTDQLNNHDKDR